MERVGCVVAGAGVVGLAIARAFARRGIETLIVDEADTIGTGTSSRNSEVIHAGIYYPKGSLKARLCVEGRNALYAFAEAHGVPHSRCGKLIVATDATQIHALGTIAASARANGVSDLEFLSKLQACQREPELRCTAALFSPSTGIIDSHGLMLAMLGDAQDHGAVISYRTRVASAESIKDGLRIETVDIATGHSFELQASVFINACGLHAPSIASSISGLAPSFVPQPRFAKGNYFSAAGKTPFKHLIYPVPEPGGLGVHLTLDLEGRMRFGPDVEWVESIDYSVDPGRADRFYDEIRKYWPDLATGSLQPAYCGIRPKLSIDGEPVTDFIIQGPATHGIGGLVNLFGIESPGLTASLAIADHVSTMV
ncbi:NAD(P)/FAD-dependent oxidoreductase [Phyllobacterium endophyticum]|uniref:FAD-dependent oxidoreductase n=1 Tax=Phyllobacterium endophyticum TaxID=1149773 RepID=A0A2P7B0W4_9HYPH|nr:NAD(P)/FAD-dependent oxidoreductase [Phyllobacterium endophyticum]MBB3237634.1 L-2-hydroxyglutarate oxidase LhgO [Phyllobacterium endophyticum]PSH60103.1 FAD-dependent oxidoreductase [Phyllobacterium endophyticum]TYR42270.1 NAD(P)/FAD-dependent oxidoreductase [Phyllobacterium endophyticum]